jgi:hypothetical protein
MDKLQVLAGAACDYGSEVTVLSPIFVPTASSSLRAVGAGPDSHETVEIDQKARRQPSRRETILGRDYHSATAEFSN